MHGKYDELGSVSDARDWAVVTMQKRRFRAEHRGLSFTEAQNALEEYPYNSAWVVTDRRANQLDGQHERQVVMFAYWTWNGHIKTMRSASRPFLHRWATKPNREIVFPNGGLRKPRKGNWRFYSHVGWMTVDEVNGIWFTAYVPKGEEKHYLISGHGASSSEAVAAAESIGASRGIPIRYS